MHAILKEEKGKISGAFRVGSVWFYPKLKKPSRELIDRIAVQVADPPKQRRRIVHQCLFSAMRSCRATFLPIRGRDLPAFWNLAFYLDSGDIEILDPIKLFDKKLWGKKGLEEIAELCKKDITLIAALHGERKSLSATDIEIVTAAREKKDVDAFDTNIKRTHRKIAVLLADESRLSGQIETHLQKQYKKIDDDEGLAIEEVRRTLGKEYDDLLDEYATDPVPLEDEKKKRELKQEELLAKAKKEDNLGTTATVKPGGGTLEL